MKKDNLYTGTIKRCLNSKNYLKDVDITVEYFKSEETLTTANIEVINHHNTRVVGQYLLLYKVNDNSYICLLDNDPDNNIPEELKNIDNIYHTKPSRDYELFVDEDSLNKVYEKRNSIIDCITRKRK